MRARACGRFAGPRRAHLARAIAGLGLVLASLDAGIRGVPGAALPEIVGFAMLLGMVLSCEAGTLSTLVGTFSRGSPT